MSGVGLGLATTIGILYPINSMIAQLVEREDESMDSGDMRGYRQELRTHQRGSSPLIAKTYTDLG